MTKPCGCKIVYQGGHYISGPEISYCPLHQNAEELKKALSYYATGSTDRGKWAKQALALVSDAKGEGK